MLRHSSLFLQLAILLFPLCAEARDNFIVVADNITHSPLPSASAFDRNGHHLGMSDPKGRLPLIANSSFPITVRYLGYIERTVAAPDIDTLFLSESDTYLPELVVESKNHKLLHILAYVREYSTLSTFSDTVFLFREKMVDFMLSPDSKVKIRTWSTPRVLCSKSYYRFYNAAGLDSVSNKCNQHFSWSDWMGIIPPPPLPDKLCRQGLSSDTVRGPYSPAEIWSRADDRVSVAVDVLANTSGRKWVPNLAAFFNSGLDFENFHLRLNYDNVVGNELSLNSLEGYSFTIESKGRGHNMFMFHRVNEPFFVTTYGEVYMLDKEYITLKEARRWDKHSFENDSIEIIEAASAPDLLPSVKALIARVDALDHDAVRLAFVPDHRLMGRVARKQNFGQRILNGFKQATGITAIRTHRNNKRNWRNFRQEQSRKNIGTPSQE